jgi:hypothetical protein
VELCLPLTLREEHRLRVSENRMLRRIFGPKIEEVTGVWKRLHNEELHNLLFTKCFRVIKSRMRWVGCIVYREMKNVYEVLVGKFEEKR